MNAGLFSIPLMKSGSNFSHHVAASLEEEIVCELKIRVQKRLWLRIQAGSGHVSRVYFRLRQHSSSTDVGKNSLPLKHKHHPCTSTEAVVGHPGEATAPDLATDSCLGASLTHKGTRSPSSSVEDARANLPPSTVTSEESHPISGITKLYLHSPDLSSELQILISNCLLN